MVKIKMNFNLISKHKPSGDQPKAIESILDGINKKNKLQVLLGITGSGKTFTIANVIQKLNKPTLILSHNKTLAAQLYGEFKTLFPHNAVEFFVSYYDYYQPEAYLPSKDMYIEKEATINEEIDRMRMRTTASLFARKDVIVVSSVSSIYTLGAPSDYATGIFSIERGAIIPFEKFLDKLITMQYERNDIDFKRGKFRVAGDTIDIFPSYTDTPFRIMFFNDEIEDIRELDYINNSMKASIETLVLYPASHFVTPRYKIEKAIVEIKKELKNRVKELRDDNKELEAERLWTRTNYDLELMEEIGFCPGIENYSRFIDGRKAKQRPYTLIDYFGNDFLTVIDESHVTLPQIRGMYNGDRARKTTLVEYGFRLPSAIDNRSLMLN